MNQFDIEIYVKIFVRQVAGTVRGLPAKAVLERNQTTDQEDRGGSGGRSGSNGSKGRSGGNGSNGSGGSGRRNDEVFHFRWGIPEGGSEEGVTRLVHESSNDDVVDDDDEDNGDENDDGECKVGDMGGRKDKVS